MIHYLPPCFGSIQLTLIFEFFIVKTEFVSIDIHVNFVWSLRFQVGDPDGVENAVTKALASSWPKMRIDLKKLSQELDELGASLRIPFPQLLSNICNRVGVPLQLFEVFHD